jgi:hypothetical protein
LYANGAPRTYQGKIERIENEMKSLPVQKMMTNSMLDYIPVKPYPEWHDYKRKSLEKLMFTTELASLEMEENLKKENSTIRKH